jgi:hypothetical protein
MLWVSFDHYSEKTSPCCLSCTNVSLTLEKKIHRDKSGIEMPKTVLPSLLVIAWLSACTPTVQLAAPDKPIEINLNVKISHEIRVKVDKDLDSLFDEDSELF